MKSTRPLMTRNLRVEAAQVRENEGGRKTIYGFIPYNSRSEYMGFYEYIAPTAFNKTLADGSDVRALQNHNADKLLGRVSNGSLRLASDEAGLHIECDLPDTEYANDVYNLIRDGYNTGLSFGFYIIKEDYTTEMEGKEEVEVHILREVKLFEVSFAVTFPAYEGTNSKARSIMDDLKGLDPNDLTDEEKTQILALAEGIRKCGEKKREEEEESKQAEEPAEDKNEEKTEDEEKPAEKTEEEPAADKGTEETEEDRQLAALMAEIRAELKKEN